MTASRQLSSASVDAVSLERALKDVEVANRRVIMLTNEMLDREERIVALSAELAAVKRTMDTRRRLEHLFRKNHTVFAVVRRARRMVGK